MKYSYALIRELLEGDLDADKLLGWLEMLGLNPAVVSREDGDAVFELETPANRGYLLSLLGVAREVLPCGKLTLKMPDASCAEKSDAAVPVVIADPDGCPYYSCRMMKNIRVASSPPELKRKIEKLGFRSANNTVDISNLVMAEIGQPLHIFDLDKLSEKIVVRRAHSGEKLRTLDGKERALNPEILVIADAAKAAALAGIMGGADSEVTLATKNILIESAQFSPKRVRRSSKNAGIISDASQRFEKGLDRARTRLGLDRTAHLLAKLCGGETGPRSEAGAPEEKLPDVVLAPERVEGLLGAAVPAGFIADLLTRMGCAVKEKKKTFLVTPPEYRNDLKEDVDLIEEIARYFNYAEIPAAAPAAGILPSGSDPFYAVTERIKDILTTLGFTETVATSFLSEDTVKALSVEAVPLLNPLTKNFNFLRPSLLPGLAETVRFNRDHGADSLRIFEIGPVYPPGRREETRLGLAASNSLDFFGLKGAAETLLAECGITGLTWSDLILNKDGKPVGFLCLPEPGLFMGEIYLDPIAGALFPLKTFREPPAFPGSRRDLSLLFPEETGWEKVEDMVRGLTMPLEKIEVFDVYKGTRVEPGSVSVSFSLTFRDPARTLTAAEVNDHVEAILTRLETECGARRRQ